LELLYSNEKYDKKKLIKKVIHKNSSNYVGKQKMEIKLLKEIAKN